MTSCLIDTSALARLAQSTEAATWTERIERGLVRMSTATRLEIGYSARSGPELRATHRPPLASMPVEYQTPAIEVQLRLADLGHHRAPSVADLIVAATAELAGLTVVHLDKDFEMIAEVTAQPIERLVVPTG